LPNTAGGLVEADQVVVGRFDDHPAGGHRRCGVDRHVEHGAPQDLAGLGVEGGDEAEAGADEDLALVIGQAAAEGLAIAPGQHRRIGAPQVMTVARVVGRNRGPAVHHIDPSLGRDRRGGDVPGVRGRPAEAAPPGNGEVVAGVDMLDRLLGRAARQRPVGDGGRRRQIEVLALQGVRRMQRLVERGQRDALALAGVLVLAAMAVGVGALEGIVHVAAGHGGQGQGQQGGRQTQGASDRHWAAPA
jgi:hypothetical protein